MINKKRIIIFFVLVILIGAFYFVSPIITQKESREKELTVATPATPLFTEIPLDFIHNYKKNTYIFAGSALIDVNGDGVDEIFIGGGQNQVDGLFRFENGQFINIATQSGFALPAVALAKDGGNAVAAGGALSIDFDNDNDVDLLVARLDGVYLYINNGGKFKEEKLDIVIEKDAIPLSLSATDLNKDGLVDIYISTFKTPTKQRTIFNKIENRSNNVMLLNKGNKVFEDITKKSGLTYNQNTFQVSFVDLNNDTWQDLVIAPDTDKVVVYENKKDGTFEAKTPLTDFGFWMGLAVGDIDDDGDQDLFFSNIGNTISVSLARKDLLPEQKLDEKWALLRNDGDFKFTNITKEKKLDDYEFGWGALFEDLNLDGLQDLLVVENYAKWPIHKIKKLDGRVLLQEVSGSFTPITKVSGLVNPYYGTSPLTADFNKDGYPDVVFINFSGPSKAYINKGGNNTYLKVSLPDNASSLGVRVDLEKMDGTILSKQVIGGIGLLTDVSNELVFGLGRDEIVKKVSIIWPANGKVQVFENVATKTRLEVK